MLERERPRLKPGVDEGFLGSAGGSDQTGVSTVNMSDSFREIQ